MAGETEATVVDEEVVVVVEVPGLLVLIQQLLVEAAGDFDIHSWLFWKAISFKDYFRARSDIPHRAFEEGMEGVMMID